MTAAGASTIFAARYRRAVLDTSGGTQEFEVEDDACRLWRAATGDDSLPPAFVDVTGIAPRDHLAMQAALQPYVDEAISKTVNVPQDIGFDVFRSLYGDAYAMGLKGVTAFRPNPVTGSVVTVPGPEADSAHCCTIEREID